VREHKNNAYMFLMENHWGPWRTAFHYVKATAGKCSRVKAECTTDGLDGVQVSAGGAYAFSRRTWVFLRGSQVRNGKGAAYNNSNLQSPSPGEDIRQVALGIHTAFYVDRVVQTAPRQAFGWGARMRFGALCLCALLLAPLHTAAAQAPARAAGVVTLATGEARLASKEGPARAIRAGDVVLEGDMIESARDGEVHLRMQDGGFLVIRPRSRFEIVSYVADGGESDKAILRLVSGGMRSISGWIGRYSARNYKVQTKTATIGIRGTDHETRVILEDSDEGEAGTYDRVYAGETVIESPEGATIVKANEAGFQSARSGKGRILAAVPKFYRPGPNEAEISRKHAEVQAEIDALREERRKAVLEKREEFHESRAKTKALVKEEAQRQGLSPSAEEREGKKALKRSLEEEKEAADDLEREIKRQAEALEADAKSGKVPRKELKARRDALSAQKKELDEMRASVKEKKALKEAAKEARADQAVEAAGENRDALKAQIDETREKRKAFRDERKAAKDEVDELRREEKRRYKEEMKADRKGAEGK
jgi:FecR protein